MCKTDRKTICYIPGEVSDAEKVKKKKTETGDVHIQHIIK